MTKKRARKIVDAFLVELRDDVRHWDSEAQHSRDCGHSDVDYCTGRSRTSKDLLEAIEELAK